MKRRPTPFELMRRNRQKLASAAQCCDSEVHWTAYRAEVEAERRARFADTDDWLKSTREHARTVPTEPEPTLLQVLLHASARCLRAVFHTGSPA